MYIYGEFSETPKGTKINDRKSIASFNSNRVTMKLATSYISCDQAKKNLELEIGGDSFETVYNKAQSKWDSFPPQDLHYHLCKGSCISKPDYCLTLSE